MGPLLRSFGAVIQGVLRNEEVPDDELDDTITGTYGGGLGIPVGEIAAINGLVDRASIDGKAGDEDFEDLGAFTTVLGSLHVPVSPGSVVDAGHRTRLEIDDDTTNAFLLGARAFFESPPPGGGVSLPGRGPFDPARDPGRRLSGKLPGRRGERAGHRSPVARGAGSVGPRPAPPRAMTHESSRPGAAVGALTPTPGPRAPLGGAGEGASS